ncbi:hypothetical protein JG687_00016105 [Phytophthora cactorum]|uniref:Uncharacterized protein n=1 Tax=Phytophthora cactorum TaxID=29920 RepID=A0A329S477_9STRA|nr:hypothetical protein Pcac1_g6876 [Phytophthora cactorum]KAG6947414.1 hypothetical protein JG687_00016105 [Phytophthora cactorum]RAW31515.1 hypothetical protein PC110_g12144 [Phytophthora cactorum]
MSSERRSYTIHEKLAIQADYKKGVKGHEFLALSSKHNVPVEAIREWHDIEDQLKAAAKNRQVATDGFVSVTARNAQGLRVKDAYTCLQAKNIYVVTTLQALSRWLSGFKRHRNLVSRRQTTSRWLPANALQICREFIQQAQYLIEKHNIKPGNTINMDQMP